LTGFDTRTDPQQAAPAPDGRPLDAQHLLSGIEPQLNEVIDAAVARVAQIEQAAVEEARQLVDRTHEEARDAYGAAIDRSSELIGRLEVLATAVNDLTIVLRTETDGVVQSLRGMRQATSQFPAAKAETQAPAPQPAPPPAPVAAPAAAEPAPPEPEVEPSPELTDLFRERIIHMRRDGKPREEAERVLLRFRLGHRFLEMLDEIYSADPKDLDEPKQGLIGKLRGRSQSH
jgi:hypothetical protein